MKSGDLVKYTGQASAYKGRVGFVTSMRSVGIPKKNGVEHKTHAMVFFPGLDPDPRARNVDGLLPRLGLHPMHLDELERLSFP
jgi:hypothetical protein